MKEYTDSVWDSQSSNNWQLIYNKCCSIITQPLFSKIIVIGTHYLAHEDIFELPVTFKYGKFKYHKNANLFMFIQLIQHGNIKQ